MLHPSARRPPSANSRHWISSTPIIVKNAAYGPSNAVSIIPPQRWPLEPVPGMVKLIICAAKTNAPITPITGIFFGSLSRRTFFTEKPAAPPEQTYIVAATAGATSASAICIMFSSFSFSVFFFFYFTTLKFVLQAPVGVIFSDFSAIFFVHFYRFFMNILFKIKG